LTAPPRLILASASPRRRELLARLGLPFEARAMAADETPRPGESPVDLVARLALVKARAVDAPGALVVGADTVVALDGEILGKPLDAADAARMLRALSGRAHEVWTGVAVVRDGAEPLTLETTCRTRVVFRELDAREIDDYVASGEPLDKAGAYAIQGGAARFVERCEGDYENVVGLPLAATAALLERAGLAPAGLSRRP
jgi:septum formation protein